MASRLQPRTLDDIAAAVSWAVGEEAPLDIAGAGTKRDMGRSVQVQATLDMSAMSGITLYEPEELVLSAKAGTTRAEAEAALAEKKQAFQFEPPDFSKLLGSDHAGTLGGMIAANRSGPRRITSGAARDHFLGFNAVSGRGEIFKSGGRVVKNVTGYDLSKVLAGSWGTLAVMSDINLKVLPAPETEATLVVGGLSDQAACKAMGAALRSTCEVSGAAHFPERIAKLSRVKAISGAGMAVTLLRLEGIKPSVKFRTGKLEEIVKPFGAVERLDAPRSRAAWVEVRDCHPFSHDRDRLVWRISVPPSEGHKVLKTITEGADARGFYDWAGGLIWLDVPVSDHASAEIVRGAIASASGHATLIRAPSVLRAAVAVFEPQQPALAALSSRLKQAFDPAGILNPGRMYP